jgi:hypothetical protein
MRLGRDLHLYISYTVDDHTTASINSPVRFSLRRLSNSFQRRKCNIQTKDRKPQWQGAKGYPGISREPNEGRTKERSQGSSHKIKKVHLGPNGH